MLYKTLVSQNKFPHRKHSDLHLMKKSEKNTEKPQKKTGRVVHGRVKDVETEELLNMALEATGLNENELINELLAELPTVVRRVIERRKIAEERFRASQRRKEG